MIKDATVDEVFAFFNSKNKHVVTFVGYSNSEYQDKGLMLETAATVLDEFDASSTIVNIGATPEGIGAVYELAKKIGFMTTGIVSTQAKDSGVALSAFVDYVFYVQDFTWGGFTKNGNQLSPTSQAMVMNSNVLIGIGGGPIGRDELIAAKKSNKEVRFFPADMNHNKAREKALNKKQPEPTDFSGAADGAL